MRLTCPNCAATYDVSDGMVPAAGRHVQCTVCHTRWFVAGAAAPALSEDQILHRLETRSRPVAVPAPAAPTAALAEPPAPAAAPEPARPDPEPAFEPEPIPEPTPEPLAQTAPPPPRAAEPAKPGDRPTVARPAPLGDLPPPPRSALRLEVIDTPAPAAAPPAESRFGRGLLLVLLLAALALAAYLYRAPLAAQVPAAAPALTAYGAAVDDLRDTVEARLAPLRRAVADATR